MEKNKTPYEVTEEDRTFFDDLVNRPPKTVVSEPEDIVTEEVVEKKVELKESEPEFPGSRQHHQHEQQHYWKCNCS